MAPINLPSRSRRPWFLAIVLAIAFVAGLGLDLVNYQQVFPGTGQVHFVDADCYSRMTRVRAVCIHPGTVLRHHEFENYPAGTTPHTTVPLDYLTAGLRGLFGLVGLHAPRDLAGAWISPLLGLAAIVALWVGAKNAGTPGGWPGLAIFVASPIVAHGFALGRPDHQSLELAAVAIALSAEWAQWQAPSRGWGIVGGVAWAIGLWTSLYEPLILVVAVVACGLSFDRARFLARERLAGWAAGASILLVALWIEGWRTDAIPGFGAESSGAEYFAAWSRQISELQSLPPWSGALYHWTGWGIVAAPVALAMVPGDRRAVARAHLVLLLLVFALTCWQVRWGYFLPLVYALSLPSQFEAIPARWRTLAAAGLLLGCWPIASEWWTRLNPAAELVAQLDEQREDASLLREVAAFLENASTSDAAPAGNARGILAPWWLSPPLAYWSRQPAVAGSSHESLPGIVDVDRFYVATDPAEAAQILRARQVRWVVAYEPERIAATAAPLLGRPVLRRSMCAVLYDHPESAPPFLRLALVNPYFKVYEVRSDALPPP